MFLRFILVACVELILIFGLVLSKTIAIEPERVRHVYQQISNDMHDPVIVTGVTDMPFIDFVKLAGSIGVLAFLLIEGLIALRGRMHAWRTSTIPSNSNVN